MFPHSRATKQLGNAN